MPLALPLASVLLFYCIVYAAESKLCFSAKAVAVAGLELEVGLGNEAKERRVLWRENVSGH